MSNHALPKEQTFQTLGGRITCQQCQAMSKRTKQQCRAPAMKGKRVCKTHGGKSTGPKTQAGRQRCADARTIHGNETRQARTERSLATARLAVLEAVGHLMGFTSGTRTRGPKPTRMSEAYPELQQALNKFIESRGNQLIVHPQCSGTKLRQRVPFAPKSNSSCILPRSSL